MVRPWKWLSITRSYWHAPVMPKPARGARLAIEDTIDDYELIVYPGCDKATALIEAIRAVESLRGQLAEELHLLVAEARSEGVSWGQIGRHLECSRQAAHQRFGSGLTPDQVRRLEDQLDRARKWAEQFDLQHGNDERFEKAIVFLEEQQELDQEGRVRKRPT
ncbi:hypothetical protein ACFU3E_14180 [Streptomyces sp. NPDC057424]|uniref:hypothetical protein n=1 Tax=Streptomyces sp. NPDC057424 TaxID=3346127 RepID=UPI003696EB55